MHAVSEVYIPGSAGDDQEAHPTFPVADGRLSEAVASEGDEESAEEPVYTVEHLAIDLRRLRLAPNERSTTKTPIRTTRGALVVGKLTQQKMS